MGFPCGSTGEESGCLQCGRQVRSLGWEDPLEKGTAAHSSILAWRIPQTVQDCIVHGVAKSQTGLRDFPFHWP